MDLPENCLVHCLVVENDDKALTQEMISDLRPLANGVELKYVLETEAGIPFGRNRAANEAIKSEHDLLVFVDDDEIVAKDWLVRLITGYRNSHALLLGAPMLADQSTAGLNRRQIAIHNSIARRYNDKVQRAASKASLNETADITIDTNNWIGETRLFSEYNIWFDETMRFTGGTDSKFYADVKAKNLTVGWVKDAYVYETITQDRLSFSYQYFRAKSRSTTHFNMKLKTKPFARFTMIFSLISKSLSAIFLALALPFNSGRTLLKLARTTGWIAGRVSAAFGRRSKLYTSVTGN